MPINPIPEPTKTERAIRAVQSRSHDPVIRALVLVIIGFVLGRV